MFCYWILYSFSLIQEDALKLGFSVSVVENAVKAVNVNPDDGEKAIGEMKNLGASLIIVWVKRKKGVFLHPFLYSSF